MSCSIQQRLLVFSVITILSLSGCSEAPDNPKPLSLKDIAQQTTVNISGKGSGSGVIIGRNGKTYYVLTSKHVVGIRPGKIEDQYFIKTGKDEYEINYNRVKKSSKLDLAVLEFNSNKNYITASLSKNLYRDQIVYMSGWIDCLKEEKYEFNSGSLLKILSSRSELSGSEAKTYDKDRDFSEGYHVKYTNSTIRGLSGSPVFDESGHVVAIHGKPGEDREYQYDFKACPPLNSSFSPNWGIPISAFLNSSLASEIPLQVDQNSLKDNTPSKTKNEESNSEPTGGIFKRPNDN